MILSFGDKRTEAFAEGRFVRAFQGFAGQASKRLAVLDAATSLNDLRALRSNRLEALRATEQASIVSASTISGGSAFAGQEESSVPRPSRL